MKRRGMSNLPLDGQCKRGVCLFRSWDNELVDRWHSQLYCLIKSDRITGWRPWERNMSYNIFIFHIYLKETFMCTLAFGSIVSCQIWTFSYRSPLSQTMSFHIAGSITIECVFGKTRHWTCCCVAFSAMLFDPTGHIKVRVIHFFFLVYWQ